MGTGEGFNCRGTGYFRAGPDSLVLCSCLGDLGHDGRYCNAVITCATSSRKTAQSVCRSQAAVATLLEDWHQCDLADHHRFHTARNSGHHHVCALLAVRPGGPDRGTREESSPATCSRTRSPVMANDNNCCITSVSDSHDRKHFPGPGNCCRGRLSQALGPSSDLSPGFRTDKHLHSAINVHCAGAALFEDAP